MSFFTNRYKKICPDFERVETNKQHLRINTLKGGDDAEKTIKKRLNKLGVRIRATPLPFAYEYEARFQLSGTTEHLLGNIYLQNLASQAVPHALAPKKNTTIVDMAAAPGSKTTLLAQLMHNTGRIIALDSNAQRLVALRDNCARLGVTNVLALKKDARYATDLDIEADAVLLDAPCSGNYCSGEGWDEKRNINDIKQNARVQKELLKAAAMIAKPGGIIIYSTCSLEPEEDELVVDYAVRKLGLALEKIPIPDLGQSPGITEWEGKRLDPSLARAARFWPHKTGTEGFFIARLKK